MNELREEVLKLLEERPWLATSLVGVLVAVLLWTAWDLNRGNAALRRDLDERRDTLRWMQAARSEALELKARLPKTTALNDAQSLLTTVEKTVRDSGLEKSLSRLEPDDKGSIRFWFDKVDFVQLMGWLTGLQKQFAIQVERIALKRSDLPGKVEARLVMSHGAGGE